MFVGGDLDGLAGLVKAYAIIAHAKAKFRWIDALQALDVSFASGSQAGESVQNSKGSRLGDGSKLIARGVGPDDLSSHDEDPGLTNRRLSREVCGRCIRSLRARD
jgi:hypothetical protein